MTRKAIALCSEVNDKFMLCTEENFDIVREHNWKMDASELIDQGYSIDVMEIMPENDEDLETVAMQTSDYLEGKRQIPEHLRMLASITSKQELRDF